MEKEQQNRNWNSLSNEAKQEILRIYNDCKIAVKETEYGNTLPTDLLERRYGFHNLNPVILKTWKDVLARVASDIDNNIFDNYVLVRSVVRCPKLIEDHLEASYRIATIIDLGYGGLITSDEWNDSCFQKFKIVPFKNGGFQVIRCYSVQHKDILAFRDRKLAEEFLSYPDNLSLVERYYYN